MAEIVLVHGAWHGDWCWEDVASGLRDRNHTVHAVALPGHDQPGSPARIWNRVSQYVAEVDRVVNTCDEPPILVGHSMGGYTVQRYLERHQARAGVLVASVPRRGALPANLRLLRERPGAVLRASVTADYYGLVDSPAQVRHLFLSPHTPDDTVEALSARLQNESALAILTLVSRPPRPSRVTTPVHVIAAEGDAVFSLAEQHDLAAAYRTEAVVLPGGHDLMVDTTWPLLVDELDRIATEA